MIDIDANKIMREVIDRHKDHPKWDSAAFEKIKRVSNTKVGDVGQDFIEALCNVFAFEYKFPLNKKGVRAKQSPWDIQINGVKFELKTATEDVSGAFQFNHIRYHRPYQGVICLGIAPNQIYFHIWSKAEITTGKAGNLVSMEKGANASYKLTKKPATLVPIEKFSDALQTFISNFEQ